MPGMGATDPADLMHRHGVSWDCHVNWKLGGEVRPTRREEVPVGILNGIGRNSYRSITIMKKWMSQTHQYPAGYADRSVFA